MNKNHVWLTRLAGSFGYISFLIAWTSLLGMLAFWLAPLILNPGIDPQGFVLPEQTTADTNGQGNIVGYIFVFVLLVVLWSILVLQSARFLGWIQNTFSLSEESLLSLKVGSTAAGWLLFAPLLQNFFAGVNTEYVWLISSVMIVIGITSFAVEHVLAKRFKLKHEVIW